MKKGSCIAFILMANFLCGQKIVKKSIVSQNTSFIQIDATYCFDVFIENSETNELVVEAIIDGEYTEDLLLKTKEEGATLFINTGFQPGFINPNDKLSAHKVVSISLHVKIPKYKEVFLTGTSVNVSVEGAYKNLRFVLNDGRCHLKVSSEKTFIKTQSGDIFIISAQADIKATSKYGEIYMEEIPNGDNQFELTTVTGNIHVKKTD